MKFSSLRLTDVSGVQEHIMQMRDIATQLKTLEVEMSDFLLVHYILNTLPQQYGPFKISYNTDKDKWSINGLLTMCVHEEVRLKMELGESTLMAMEGNDQNQAKKNGKVKYHPKLESRRPIGVFSARRRGTCKRIAPNSRNGLRRKVNQSHLFVMNLIWLMLFITHGGLILVLQSMCRIPCRVCET